MRDRTAIVVVLAMLAFWASPAAGQPYAELRGSTAHYRYVDVGYSFARGPVLDALYIGSPGLNELYLGAGFAWQATPSLNLTPIVYGVVGLDEGSGERGAVIGSYLTLEKGPYRLIAYLGRFVRIDGDVPSYDFLDTGDLTRVVSGPWELGVSSSVFRTEGEWSHQTGPMVKRTDSLGFWALSVRFGFDDELRLVRMLSF
jgi:hypothetical protein